MKTVLPASNGIRADSAELVPVQCDGSNGYDRGSEILAELERLRGRQEALVLELDRLHEGMGMVVRIYRAKTEMNRKAGRKEAYEYRH